MNAEELHDAPFWAITCFFNPAGFKRRQLNYRVFRARLRVPLVTVELAYGPSFELQKGDADILIQLRGRDVMWQKERLLDLALRAVPRQCRFIAWLDCDLLFERDDWPDRVVRILDRCMMVQPFDAVYDLGRDGLSERPAPPKLLGYGFASAWLNGRPEQDPFLRRYDNPSNRPLGGLAWAARREVIEELGFYDACIIGGGDDALRCAVLGKFYRSLHALRMGQKHFEHYLAWAEPAFQLIEGQLGCAEGSLYHLWHGEKVNRGYRERQIGLRKYQFDPKDDLVLDENDCWRWNSDKPELHEYVRNYFVSRKEDG